jgi:hypothetical protein
MARSRWPMKSAEQYRATPPPGYWPHGTASPQSAAALPAGIGAALARAAGEEGAVSELDRLEAAMSECREMIREAHAATKDLRAAVREARQELRALARDEVAAQIQPEVSRQLEELGERTGEAIAAATQKVIAEFDRFGESLLGKETYWQKASGRRAAARPDTDVVPPGILSGEEKG